MLLGDTEPVDIEPSAIVAMPRAHTEEAELGTNPVTFAYIERLAETGEFLAVKTVEECSLSCVVGFLRRLLGTGVFHLHTEVKILVGINLDRLASYFLPSLIGFLAVDIDEIHTILAAFKSMVP